MIWLRGMPPDPPESPLAREAALIARRLERYQRMDGQAARDALGDPAWWRLSNRQLYLRRVWAFEEFSPSWVGCDGAQPGRDE